MPGTTPAGIPYPLAAEAISDYPAVAKSAAERVPWLQRGLASIPVAQNAITGSLAVTFSPSFRRPPTVVASGVSRQWIIVTGSPTVSSITLVATWALDARNGAAANISSYWIAVDPAGSGG